MIRPYLALAQMLAMLGWLCSPASAVDASPASRGPDLELLRATQQVFRDAAAKVAPCMVRIDTVGGAQPSAVPGRGSGDDSQSPFQERIGSSFTIADGPTTGLVYASDGWIVASSFNFVRDPSLVSVTLADGRRFAADLVARDQVRKLALLKIDAKDLSEPAWKPLSEVRVGEWVIALGLGLGSEQPSINVGIVSALQRMNRNAVQTDAKLSPANYGGPLVDIEGRVVGICVPMAQRPGELAGAEMYDSGVGFVLPTERVHEIVERLRTGESIYRGWLGIQLDPQARGVARIQKLADPSPLREAGVLPGDHIVRANDRPIRNFQQLVQALYMIPAGDEVVVVTERKGEQRELKIKLARNTDLGPLPAAEEPENPFSPPTEPDDSGGE